MSNAKIAIGVAAVVVVLKVLFGDQVSELPNFILIGFPVLVFGGLAAIVVWGLSQHWNDSPDKGKDDQD